jgi:crotonobetainyl-CoA:carnitine CoA-transferase CaiB-like acyl-CoA transferase
MLAQYGADVVKVEHLPDGDPLRSLKDTALFELLNQGKRSIGINLKTEEGKAIVHQLAGEADVFVENFREGVMDELGLGYADISEVNPDLIYLSLRGLSGKNAVHASHDLNFIANSGCGEWFLESGVPNYSTQFGDIVAGMLVPVTKLLFHLANPARRGMHLISCADEAFRTLYLPRAYDRFKAEALPEQEREKYGVCQHLNGQEPHTRYYRCRDGLWVSLNAIQPKHWETFCVVVDRPQWKSRMLESALVPEVEKLFMDAPSTYWEALAAKREVCLFRVLPWNEHVSFSQARPQLATDPFTWCGFAPNDSLKACSELGEDSFAVLHSMGVTNKEMSEYLSAGIVSQPEKKNEKQA